MALERQEGRGTYSVLIAISGPAEPIRMVIQYVWPPSLEHVNELFDEMADAVFEEGTIDIAFVRSFEQHPSAYVNETVEYVRGRLASLEGEGKGQ